LVEAALLSGSNKDSIGETINIGTKEKIKMHDLVIMLSRLIGLKNVEIEFDEKRVRPFDVDVLVSDNKKAADLLGWKPKTKLENGLKRSIEWFRENDNKWPWEKSCSFVSKS
jgi:nucleoside-diphosphate-sugar epimerase